MSNPVNYVDLYDQLYNAQQLTGFTDDGQITAEELNSRLAVVRANMQTMNSALNSVYSSMSEGAHYKDYMLPFWEVLLNRTWTLTPADIVNMRYRAGFDPGGIELVYPENMTGFHFNDVGSGVAGPTSEILIFRDGVLLVASNYDVHTSQGGFSIYIKESAISGGSKIVVVVLRKFNQRGLTYFGPCLNTNTGATTSAPYDIIVSNLSTLGQVYDLRYYKLFTKLPTDNYYRPMDESRWSSRKSPTSDAVLFTVPEGAVSGQKFAVVCTADFWKFEYEGTVTENSFVYKVDLLQSDSTPSPIWNIESLDVWVDGRLQRPGLDYWIEWGGLLSKGQPPRLIFRNIQTGYRTIKVLHNAPYDEKYSFSIRESSSISAKDAVYRLPAADRQLRLLQDVGIVFSGGYLHNVGDGINLVADNLGLHLENLPYTEDLYFRMRFVFTSSALNGALSESLAETPLERFIALVGLLPDGTKPDGNSAMSFDFMQSYRTSHNITDLVDSPAPVRYANYFNALYFWVRDELPSISTGVSSFDCREGVDTTPFDPWSQGSDDLALDVRPIVESGYVTNRTFDARNN